MIAFIPLRSGSKSIPLKNIKTLYNKPLAQWVIDECHKSKYITQVWISTDSKVISDELKNVEVFRRSPETATDAASSESALLEFAKTINLDETIVFVQATSPLITSKEIDEGIEKLISQECDSVVSVVEQKRFIWHIDGSPQYDLNKRPQRQSHEGFLVENGAFYISKVKDIRNSNCRVSGKIGLVKCSPETYYEIDEPEDWIILEQLIQNREKKIIPQKIKLFVSDIDGTLTDACNYVDDKGKIIKKFNVRDGYGFQLLKEKGVPSIWLTYSKENCITKRFKALKGVDELYMGIENKKEFLYMICKNKNIKLSEVAYIGDDTNDLEVMKIVGLSFAPNDSEEKILDVAKIVLKRKGGEGAVREAINYILDNQIY